MRRDQLLVDATTQLMRPPEELKKPLRVEFIVRHDMSCAPLYCRHLCTGPLVATIAQAPLEPLYC